MSLNRENYKYRKIYTNYYGPIPKESNGRSYDIHHIDGNHNNNSPDNIKAVTIQEHYDIHYAQKDYGSCLAIAARMNISPNKLSELSSKAAQKRVKEGTHHFLGKNNPSYRKLADGTHPFLDSERQRQKALKEIAEGRHNFLGGKLQRKRLEQGTHHNLVIHTCPTCGKVGQGPGMFRWHYENCRNVSI